MQIAQLQRDFRYNGAKLPDPNPTFSLSQVRDFYAAVYPEIISADIEGPTQVGAVQTYNFRRAVGTKGHAAAVAPAPAELPPGVKALARLLKVAQGHSGQCRHIAAFLLGLYNGNRFKFDLTDFRCIDQELFDDCIEVLKMDSRPKCEVHQYFKDGGRIWEELAKQWGIRDYSKQPC